LVQAIDVDKCSILGFEGETYTLVTNVSTSETTCFTITASDVTLDCGEYSITITNPDTKSDYNGNGNNGIYSDKPNTIIKNCDKSVQSQVQNQKKVALFDIVSEIVTEPKKSGDDLIMKVSLINFGSSSEIDANLIYTISDENGQIIKQYTKIVPVKTQTEFLEHINTSGIMNGDYTLKIELKYDGQTFPAHTEKAFYVGTISGIITIVRNTNLKTVLLPGMTIILLIGVYIKAKKNKSKENTNTVSDNTVKDNKITNENITKNDIKN